MNLKQTRQKTRQKNQYFSALSENTRLARAKTLKAVGRRHTERKATMRRFDDKIKKSPLISQI